MNLNDDGCLIFEREETLRLTSSGNEKASFRSTSAGEAPGFNRI